jgi:hypothetical protein
MPYLFESEVEPAVTKNTGNDRIQAVKSLCVAETQGLQQSHPRVPPGYPFPDREASDQVDNMGSKSKRVDRLRPGSPHASDEAYCGGGWQLASGNQNELRGIVHTELQNAYDLGLDIRHFEVVGKMYKLAARVFLEVRPYASIVREKDEIR